MVGLITATIVAAVMGRPKKQPKGAAVATEAAADPLAQMDADPVLDFGDELAQMDRK